MTEFKPKIIGFLCNWCSYAGADLAGVSRFQYPPNIRVIRVMCSGRIDPIIMVEAFIHGADGVFVGGCHLGDCHYQEGNYQAERKIKMTKKLIEKAGIEPERLRLEWVAAAEGQRFADLIRDFTDQTKELGPVKGKDGDILAAREVAADNRLRELVGKERELTEDGNVYKEKISQERFDELMNEAIETEFTSKKILLLVKDKGLSVKEISKSIDLPSEKVLQNIVEMRHRGVVAMDRIDGTSPIYIAIEGGS